MGLEAFANGIAFPVTADLTGMKTGLAEAQGELDKTQSSFTKTLTQNSAKIGAAATLAGGAIVGGLGLATKASVDFETGMAEVFTLMPGMSKKAMGEMTDQVRDLSVEMGVLPEQLIPALYQAISAGVPPDNVFEFMRTANKAAVGGVTDLETAVDGITSVVNAYGKEVLTATQASDQMFTAVKLGKTNFEELSGYIYQVVPTASALGVSFGDVSAALATMTAQGTPTRVAATQLRQALVELSKDGGETSDIFKEISGKSFKDFIAGGGNVQDALKLMEEHAKNTGVGVNDLFTSVEAGNAVLALTGKGTESFSNALSEMEKSAGASDAAFKTMDETAGRSMEKLMAAFEDIKLEVGDELLPILKDDILPVLKSVVGVFKGIPDTFKPVVLVVAALGAALVVLGPLLVALPGLITAIGIAFTILSANPIVLVIGGLILLFYVLETQFGVLSTAAKILGDGFGWLSGVVGGFVDWVVNAVNWTDVLGFAFKVLLGPIGWIMIAMDALGISWDDVWAGMISITQGAVSFITGIIDGMVGGIKWAVNAVIDGINVMIRGLNLLNFEVPDWVPLIGGQSIGFHMQQIPRLAEGGIVTQPTVAMIGEAGPEAVVPLTGSNAGAGGVTIKIDKMEVRNDQDIQKVARELYTLIDRTNRGRGTI